MQSPSQIEGKYRSTKSGWLLCTIAFDSSWLDNIMALNTTEYIASRGIIKDVVAAERELHAANKLTGNKNRQRSMRRVQRICEKWREGV